jgi:hypothetical protein
MKIRFSYQILHSKRKETNERRSSSSLSHEITRPRSNPNFDKTREHSSKFCSKQLDKFTKGLLTFGQNFIELFRLFRVSLVLILGKQMASFLHY